MSLNQKLKSSYFSETWNYSGINLFDMNRIYTVLETFDEAEKVILLDIVEKTRFFLSEIISIRSRILKLFILRSTYSKGIFKYSANINILEDISTNLETVVIKISNFFNLGKVKNAKDIVFTDLYEKIYEHHDLILQFIQKQNGKHSTEESKQFLLSHLLTIKNIYNGFYEQCTNVDDFSYMRNKHVAHYNDGNINNEKMYTLFDTVYLVGQLLYNLQGKAIFIYCSLLYGKKHEISQFIMTLLLYQQVEMPVVEHINSYKNRRKIWKLVDKDILKKLHFTFQIKY